MPLFFLVGGVAHTYSLESRARVGGTVRGRYAVFVQARAARLLRPTLVFLAVWVVLGVVADLAGWTSGRQATLVTAALVLVPQLLWFVGIYLGVAAFAPAMARAHRSWGVAVPFALALAACLVDLARFGAGLGVVGNLNFAFVWLALHQWGLLWRDGRLTYRLALALAVLGSVGLGLAVTVGPYPTSMVGLPGDDVSNMAPPTAALLAQGLALIGVAALLRGPMRRALRRPALWRGVVTAGAFAMTAFLWHLTALLGVLLGDARARSDPARGRHGRVVVDPAGVVRSSCRCPLAAARGGLRPLRPRGARGSGARSRVPQRGWTRCPQLPPGWSCSAFSWSPSPASTFWATGRSSSCSVRSPRQRPSPSCLRAWRC